MPNPLGNLAVKKQQLEGDVARQGKKEHLCCCFGGGDQHADIEERWKTSGGVGKGHKSDQ